MVEIVNKPYSAELAKRLTPALGDYSADILGEIKRGESMIWEIGNTLYVVRIERDSQGLEMVVVVAVGANIKETAKRLIEQAHNIGCYSVRFHTSHKGLARLIALPFEEVERVYRLDVGGLHGSK